MIRQDWSIIDITASHIDEVEDKVTYYILLITYYLLPITYLVINRHHMIFQIYGTPEYERNLTYIPPTFLIILEPIPKPAISIHSLDFLLLPLSYYFVSCLNNPNLTT